MAGDHQRAVVRRGGHSQFLRQVGLLQLRCQYIGNDTHHGGGGTVLKGVNLQFPVAADRLRVQRGDHLLDQWQLADIRRDDQTVPAGIGHDHRVGIAQFRFPLHLIHINLLGLRGRNISR